MRSGASRTLCLKLREQSGKDRGIPYTSARVYNKITNWWWGPLFICVYPFACWYLAFAPPCHCCFVLHCVMLSIFFSLFLDVESPSCLFMHMSQFLVISWLANLRTDNGWVDLQGKIYSLWSGWLQMLCADSQIMINDICQIFPF
jgi:hypothetical protein